MFPQPCGTRWRRFLMTASQGPSRDPHSFVQNAQCAERTNLWITAFEKCSIS